MPATSKENGAVLVEFVLVLPLLLFLIFGFLQFGLAMHAKINSTHLTAEGARYVAVNQNPGLTASPVMTMQDYIRSRAATPKLRTARVRICFPAVPKVGDPVKVVLDNVSYVPFIGTLPGGLSLPSLPVSSETTMRLEAVPTNFGPPDTGC